MSAQKSIELPRSMPGSIKRPLAGFVLAGQDNDSHMCACCDRVFDNMPGLEICSACGYRVDSDYTNHAFELVQTGFDFSTTCDGAHIASARFREFCLRQKFRFIEFRPLPRAMGFFHFLVHREVPFDADTRKTRFIRLCAKCGRHESIVGATPAFLKIQEPLREGFWRSDLLFGSRNEKSPLIFVGISTREKVEQQAFAGLDILPAYMGNAG